MRELTDSRYSITPSEVNVTPRTHRRRHRPAFSRLQILPIHRREIDRSASEPDEEVDDQRRGQRGVGFETPSEGCGGDDEDAAGVSGCEGERAWGGRLQQKQTK